MDPTASGTRPPDPPTRTFRGSPKDCHAPSPLNRIQLLDQEFLRRNDFGGNAFLLVRHPGMSIGECADLSYDCLRSTGQNQWAVHVPLGKLHLLGHTSPGMTMRYVDVALTDLRREFGLTRSQRRHLVPQPKISSASLPAGLDGVIDALLADQHVLEMFRRALPVGASRTSLARLSNRLTKILTEARKLTMPREWAQIGRLCRPPGS